MSANDSVGTANGTLLGGATISGGVLTTTGAAGSLSSGVPQSGVQLPPAAVSGITGPFTVQAWFTASAVSGGYSTIFSFSGNNTSNYVLATPARGNSPFASSISVIGGGGSTSEQQASGIRVDDGALHDMIVTYDGATLSYYIDGVRVSFSSLPPLFTDFGLNLSTLTYVGINGGSPFAADVSLNGSTRDFRIFGQALSPSQITNVHALGADATNAAITSALTVTSSKTDVAAAANLLIATAAAQTSPYTLTSGFSPSQSLTLANAEKWTNLPGTPPNDGTRVGPVMGGGSVSYTTYELSSVTSTGQSVSPRVAALNTAAASTSAAGYTELYEIRSADNVLSASGGGNQYNYSDYRADVLNGTTPSASTDFMIKFAGHHLAYAFTYNFPAFNGGKAYVSASPMFLGLEPPDYQSTGTDLTSTENGFIFGTNSGTAGSFLALFPDVSGNSLTTITAANAAAAIPARTGVTSAAISGATGASYTISSTAASDNGFYFCKVSNASGTTNSNTVALSIALTANASLYHNAASAGTSPAPVIKTQPQSATVTTGSSVTFTVASDNATGYQWYKIPTTHRAAMEAQRAAASRLAVAIQADSSLTGTALLSGTFNDIVQAPTMSGDTGFPATYATGATGRGAAFSSMTAAQQATFKPLIKGLIEAYVNNASSDAAAVLLADYESDAAINATYVGYAKGTGSATSPGSAATCNFDATINQEQTPTNSQHSYIRVDGPRCWVEIVVQNAVLYQSNAFVHYHSIYRDKLSDYGCEFGSFLNSSATSTTYTRPSFTTQPASVTGSSATFTAAATANVGGSAVTPAYQWYSGTAGSGTAIGNATSSSYTTTTAGSYYVTATTAYGTAASNTVTLTVSTAATPTITTQPTSQTVTSPGTATFTVAATGNGTLSYQWYNAGGAISGVTAASYTTGTAGTYYVVVTNTIGSSTASATSNAVSLTVNFAPTITTQPASQTITSGNTATFSVVANGSGTLSYQWYNSAGAISGAASASYTTGTAGSYYVIVTNAYGSTPSNTVTLTVNSAPAIATPPASQSVVLGNSATFSVTATGTGTLSYQWYFGSSAIPGATASSYTIAATTNASAGNYYVVVTNLYGSVASSTATLTIIQPYDAFLSTYGLTGVPGTTDTDGDGISNLVEFVLGGNPTVPNTSILPTVSYTTSGGTSYLIYSFYTTNNLGSVAWTVEYSSDLGSTWSTAVDGTGGVTISTSIYNSSSNLNTATIPDASGNGRIFARLRATQPGNRPSSRSAVSRAKTAATPVAKSRKK